MIAAVEATGEMPAAAEPVDVVAHEPLDAILIESSDVEAAPNPAFLEDPEDAEREQLIKHARQLATHLRGRQQELDRREARLNAQTAELESGMRQARMWLGERQQELELREQELARRESTLSERTSEVAAAQSYLQSARQELEGELNARERELSRREAELTEKQQLVRQQAEAQQQALLELDAERERLEEHARWARQRVQEEQGESLDNVRRALAQVDQHRLTAEERLAREATSLVERAAALDTRQAALDRQAKELGTRLQALEAAEGLLEERHSEFERMRKRFATMAVRGSSEPPPVGRAAPLPSTTANEVHPAALELVERQRRLERWADELEARRASLEQMRGELLRLHREALETRLATEEVWVQLSAATPADLLQGVLAESRRRLADHFRLARADLEARKQELSRLDERAREQFAQLSRGREELEAQLAARKAELESLDSRLRERWEETQRRDVERQRLADAWEIERSGYQQEIRSLLFQLRRREAALA